MFSWHMQLHLTDDRNGFCYTMQIVQYLEVKF